MTSSRSQFLPTGGSGPKSWQRNEPRAVSDIPWFKVDDNLALHQKTLRAGNAAMGMWVRAGSWAMQQLSDGFVPDEVVALLGGKSLARKLVDADLWDTVPGGYVFHQWQERQPTRTQVEHDRDAARTRKERWRERHGNGVPNGGGNDAPSQPDPSRPQNPDVPSVVHLTQRDARGPR
jgi:hypothetical protein